MNDLDAEIGKLVETTVRKAKEQDDNSNGITHIPGAPQDIYTGPHKTGIDEGGVRSFLVADAANIFGPWKQLPNHGRLREMANRVTNARGYLHADDVLQYNDAVNLHMGQSEVPVHMSAIKDKFDGWQGVTGRTVRERFIERFGAMLFLQTNTLSVLKLTAEAYAALAEQAHDDIVKLVTEAEAAMAAIGDAGAEGTKNLIFNLLTAAAGMAACANPLGVALAAAAAGGLAGVAKDMIKLDEVENRKNDLATDSISGVWQNMKNRADELKQDFMDGEAQLHRVTDAFYNSLGGQFTLGRGATENSSVTDRAANLMHLHAQPDITSAGLHRPPKSKR